MEILKLKNKYLKLKTAPIWLAVGSEYKNRSTEITLIWRTKRKRILQREQGAPWYYIDRANMNMWSPKRRGDREWVEEKF